MLSAKNISVHKSGRCILQLDACTLASGRVTGVLGANGAGKSTLLATLSGDLQPNLGEVLLAEKSLSQWQANKRAQHLAVLPQQSSLSFSFSVAEVVAMGRLPHATSHSQNQQFIEQALAQTHALHLLQRNYLQLSGGERQRVQLARVLVQLAPYNEQRVLLLDEPTSALDPLHQHCIMQSVQQLARLGCAVLVVLHDLNLAARYCDDLVLLNTGLLHAQGSTKHVLTAENIQSVFGLQVIIGRHPEQDCPLVIAK
ncbi:heme ABC transporter ATP-binding protein [Pseudomonas sp. F1_0610]|uniref:heme ABC transporter ATP-binding protein n=1 Tax=Pseudomonas sp. F1_0610 TaxID=3114284 RepID=UPI0039C2ED45